MSLGQALILAAGRGSRLGPLTLDRPKALLRLGEETLIDRQLRLLAEREVRRVTVVVGHQGALLQGHLGPRWPELELTFCENLNPQSGTTISLTLGAEGLDLDQPFLLTHGDLVYLPETLERCLAGSSTMVSADPGYARRTGDEVLVWALAGQARGVAKGPPRPPFDRVGEFVGLSRFEPTFAKSFLSYCRNRPGHEDYEQPALDAFLQEEGGPCQVAFLESQEFWMNVNYPDDLEEARHRLG